jgi:hypothetical protein
VAGDYSRVADLDYAKRVATAYLKRYAPEAWAKGDVVALISAYGRRVIGSGFGWDSNPMTLSQAITDEMSKSDIEKYVNIPISKTGFKF